MAEIYANLDKVASLSLRGAKTLGAKLAEAKDLADLSYLLATIKTDVALDVSPEQLTFGVANKDALIEYFARYEFKRWLNEVMNGGESSVTNGSEQAVKLNPYQATPSANERENTVSVQIDRSQYQCLLELSELKRWIDKLNQAKCIAIDTETDSLDYMVAHLVGVSFALENGEAAYLPLRHDYLGAPQQVDFQTALSLLKPVLENPEIHKVGQNIKYDLSIFARHGIEVQGVSYDTMLLSYVLDSTGRHNMDELAKRYLGHQTIHFEDIAGKGKAQLTFNQIPLEQAAEYAAEDADITMKLQQVLWEKVVAQPELVKLYQTMELPLASVLSRIERHGVLIDSDALFSQSQQIGVRLTALEQQAYELAGQQFNLASTKQLQEILFDKLSLPVLKKTPKGAPSTNEEVLEELAYEHALPKFLWSIVD